MSNTCPPPEDVEERFHQEYNELLEAGFSEVECAERAPHLTGEVEPPPTNATQRSEVESATSAISELLNIPAQRPPDSIITDKKSDSVNERSQSEKQSETSNDLGAATSRSCSLEISRDQPSMDLITLQRVQEFIEIGHASQDEFRDLIRFIWRTMSNPECISASFAPDDDTVTRDTSSAFDGSVVLDYGEASFRGGSVLISQDESVSKEESTEGKPIHKPEGAIHETTAGTVLREQESKTEAREDDADGLGEAVDAFPTTIKTKGVSPQRPDQSLVGANIAAASEIWRVLRELDSAPVSGAVVNALEFLTQSLIISNMRFCAGGRRDGDGDAMEVAGTRSTLLVLEHPEAQDPDFERILGNLFKTSMSLTAERRDDLCSFMAELEEERFSRYLGVVQQFIALRLYTGGDPSSVLEAVHFLHILYRANHLAKKVADESFYSEAINAELSSNRSALMENYGRWREDHRKQDPRSYTSLISFGEVLDPASKAAVLSVDSQVQMRGMIDNEVQEALWSGVLTDGEITVVPYLLLRVRRSHIVEDSLQALVMLPDEDLKKPLRVQFVGEEGVDEGGVRKEYFQVMLRELLDPKYSILKYDPESRRFWFNSDSLESQEEFELVGMLLGIAIYNGIILDVRFPLVVYKLLRGEKPSLQDLKEAQPSLGRGLQQLLDFEGDVEAVFSRTFQISYEVFGAIKTFDLKEDGGNENVTNRNRQEYVDLYVKWVLVESVRGQFKPFERGFHKVVGGRALALFRAEELELLICGNPHLDFRALEENSIYEDGYREDSLVIRNFWEVVHALEEDSKRKFLKFVTGSDRAPIQGLGSNALCLVISRHGDDSDRLPSAHTCFNHLLLPPYGTKEKLADRLKIAIEQSEGFGLR